MRHKYSTPALVLGRLPVGEAGALVTLLTPDFGLLRARATGLRRSGAKLASALQTFSESDVALVRGKDGWRLTGALLSHDHFRPLTTEGRFRAGRVASLLLRLVHGESADERLYGIFADFLTSLPDLSEEAQDAAEVLVALRILAALGLDTGDYPEAGYGPEAISYVQTNRADLVKRVNRGIGASGL